MQWRNIRQGGGEGECRGRVTTLDMGIKVHVVNVEIHSSDPL